MSTITPIPATHHVNNAGAVSDADRILSWFYTAHVKLEGGVARYSRLGQAETVETFPRCFTCGQEVEDAGDHVDTAGHWPWMETVYLTAEARDAALAGAA